MKVLLLFFTLVGVVTHTHAYSMGAPDSACKRMIPGHAFDPQLDPAPYRVNVDRAEVLPGGALSLTLDGSTAFKGFIIQARDAANPDNQVGSFETSEASYMTCGRGIHNSITHKTSSDKTSVQAVWKAPSDFEGEVFFRYSVAKQYDEYWVQKVTDPVRVTRSAQVAEQPTEQPAQTTEQADLATDGGDRTPVDIVFPGNEEPSSAAPSSSSRPSTIVTTRSTTTTTTTTTTASTTTTTEPSYVSLDHAIFDGCGSSKTCFGIPENCINAGGCQAVVSYEPSGTDWLFKMVGRTEGYLAVGLSFDERMGDDLTTSCVYDGLNVDLQSGVNDGYSNAVLSPPKFGTKDFSGSYDEGYINCQFKRPNEVKVDRLGKTFNLARDKFVIFLAEGRASGGVMFKHQIKDKSSSPQSLGIVSNLEAHSKLFIKLHGAFMIGAWICAASLGILLARYYKNTWTNSTCCKVAQWFIWHRFFMLLTWALTIAGFVLIFLELNGWTEISIYENPHALLGCVTTGLCFMQPLIALLRCAPDHRQRYLFNWVHWFVGNAAQIVGIVAIFFAVDLDKAQLPKEADYLLIAFVGFHFIMHLVLSLLMCSSDMAKEKQGYNAYPMRPMNGKAGAHHMYPDYEELKRDAPGAGVRKFLLAIYMMVNLLVTAALILLVVYAPIRPSLEQAGILQPQ